MTFCPFLAFRSKWINFDGSDQNLLRSFGPVNFQRCRLVLGPFWPLVKMADFPLRGKSKKGDFWRRIFTFETLSISDRIFQRENWVIFWKHRISPVFRKFLNLDVQNRVNTHEILKMVNFWPFYEIQTNNITRPRCSALTGLAGSLGRDKPKSSQMTLAWVRTKNFLLFFLFFSSFFSSFYFLFLSNNNNNNNNKKKTTLNNLKNARRNAVAFRRAFLPIFEWKWAKMNFQNSFFKRIFSM